MNFIAMAPSLIQDALVLKLCAQLTCKVGTALAPSMRHGGKGAGLETIRAVMHQMRGLHSQISNLALCIHQRRLFFVLVNCEIRIYAMDFHVIADCSGQGTESPITHAGHECNGLQ